MLKGYEEDLAGIDFSLPPEELKAALLNKANKRADGLANKNQELLGKLSNNEDLSAAEKAKLVELEAFKSNAQIQAAKDAENFQEASRLQQEAWEKEKNGFVEQNNSYKGQLETLLIDNGLSAQLDAVAIDPKLKAGAIALLKTGGSGVFDTGATISEGKAMIGDKSLSDAVKEWSESEAGKAFCLAPNNSGGNANGGDFVPQSKTFSEMTLTEKTQLLNADPEKYNLLKGK